MQADGEVHSLAAPALCPRSNPLAPFLQTYQFIQYRCSWWYAARLRCKSNMLRLTEPSTDDAGLNNQANGTPQMKRTQHN
jgi:hypothetical protein